MTLYNYRLFYVWWYWWDILSIFLEILDAWTSQNSFHSCDSICLLWYTDFRNDKFKLEIFNCQNKMPRFSTLILTVPLTTTSDVGDKDVFLTEGQQWSTFCSENCTEGIYYHCSIDFIHVAAQNQCSWVFFTLIK